MVYIGCDHGGYEMKLALIGYLEKNGFEYEDMGCGGEAVDYPDIAEKVCAKVLENEDNKGVLICGGADKKCLYSKLGDAILKVCDRIIIYGSNGDLVEDIIAKEAQGRTYEIIRIFRLFNDKHFCPKSLKSRS